MRPVLILTVGLLLAILGAFPIASLLAAEPDPVKAGTVVTAEEPPAPVLEVPTTVITEPAPVGELTSSVSKVLELSGSAQDVGLRDLDSSLPDAVARLLIDRNTVLVVPEVVAP